MNKSLTLALLLTVSLTSISLATDSSSANFKLNDEVVENYKLKQTSSQSKADTQKTEDTFSTTDSNHRIIKEQTLDGYIEKLLTADNLVIAEKKIIDNEVVERVLNEYYPSKTISKKIISRGDDEGFYLEEYYPNGKLSREVAYINTTNRLGTEKLYDTEGVLRQEIPWVEIDPKMGKKNEERITKRQGQVNVYYPNGKIAAIFSVGKKGRNIFFNSSSKAVKEIRDAEILDFSKEDINEDCQGINLKLSLTELVELYEDEGDISYNKCGLPYRENFVYELNNINNKTISRVSFDETGMIRRITPYINGYKEGVEQKFDKQGNLTAEIIYKNGQKDGEALGYFPTKEIAFRKKYENGKVVGNLTCYFPTGDEAAVIPFKDGMKEGTAKVSSPEPKGILFVKDKIVGLNKPKTRQLVSRLTEQAKNDNRCLKVEDKIQQIEDKIAKSSTSIQEAMTFDISSDCKDLSSFSEERSRYVCYQNNKVYASYPPAYNKKQYAVISYFYDNSLKLYEIPYNKQQLQGIAVAYDTNQNIVKEVSYNKGELDDTSRTYYPNGTVENLYTIKDNSTRKLLNNYDTTGILLFSLSYEHGKKHHAYINENDKNKNIYVNYYEGQLDNIREVNSQNPLNYIEYDLALNEYAVYKNGEVVKMGKLCSIAQTPSTPAPSTTNSKDKELTSEITKLDNEMAKIKKEEIKDVKQEVKKDVKENQVLANTKPLTEVKTNSSTSNIEKKDETKTIETTPTKIESEIEIPPVILAKDAPLVEGIEPLENVKDIKKTEYKLENAIVPSPSKQEELELKADNIGPIEKPSKQNLTEAVEKSTISVSTENAITPDEEVVETKRFEYPNGNIRKTIKTRGSRTEEIKEYSKTGLLLTDTVYNKDNVIIEKYYGTGEIRRKTVKNYTDNVIMSFNSRQDFYTTGKPRYEINRQEDTLLFSDKEYSSEGKLKKERVQTSPLSFKQTEYDDNSALIKETILNGSNILVIEYDTNKQPTKLSLNNKELPVNLSSNYNNLLDDNSKIYGKAGALEAEFKHQSNKDSILEYYPNGKIKTEVVFYENGEISVKGYSKEGTLEKFAYLAPDGKLHLQKPEVSVIPSYRERYWVDYNNPNWIENQDKYAITSIARLTLDVTAYIFTELDLEVPVIIQNIYSLY